jgi:hypothetical protein
MRGRRKRWSSTNRFAARCEARAAHDLLSLAQRKRLFSFRNLVLGTSSGGDSREISLRLALHIYIAVTLVHRRTLHHMHFFLDFIFH